MPDRSPVSLPILGKHGDGSRRELARLFGSVCRGWVQRDPTALYLHLPFGCSSTGRYRAAAQVTIWVREVKPSLARMYFDVVLGGACGDDQFDGDLRVA